MPPEDDNAFGEFVPPPPGELDALLPDYDVHELIAQGGMGAVYRGLQTKLDRPVAIKVLPKRFGADMDYAARFEQEAKAMAKLSHSNIVGVFDYGETSDGALLYFIMEYVEGSDLFHRLRGRSVSYGEALPILRQICDALGYAHENGIVHRDIKPANILIDTCGNVKMADFGLAKIQKSGGTEAEEETAFGTPDYVAPEALIEGVTVDQRADIYSLGVLIYEVLTGEVPRGSFELPSVKNPAVDRRFDDVILRTVTPDRDERFSNVGEVRRVLEAIEKTPRLIAASPAATPAMPAVAASGGPATRRRGRPAHLQPKASSGPNVGLVLMLVLLFCASAGAVYWFVVREPDVAAPDIAKLFPDEDPVSAPASDPKPAKETKPDIASAGESPFDPSLVSGKAGTPAGSAKTGDAAFFGSKTGPMSDAKSTGPETIAPPPPASGDSIQPGSLRGYGVMKNGSEVPVQRAREFTDFVMLRARNMNWTALRATGEIVALAPLEHGMTGVKWFEARGMWLRIVREDGTVWLHQNQQFFPGEITGAVKAVSCGFHNVILNADGTVKVWGESYEGDGVLADPPVPLSNIVDISTTNEAVAAVGEDGRVTCWGKTLEVATREPSDEGDRIVDVEAGSGNFVALTRSGKVVSWLHAEPEKTRKVPEELGPAIAVRASHGTYAAQRRDGSWFAWGNNPKGIVDKINRIGPSPDIAFSGASNDSEEYGYLIWIEPSPDYAPANAMNDRVAGILEKSKQRFADLAESPFREELAKLNTLYVSGLDRGAAAAEGEGDKFTAGKIREDLAAAEKAIAEAEAANALAPVIVDPADTDPELIPAELRLLRNTYRLKLGEYQKDRDIKATAVLNTYLSDLEMLASDVEKTFGGIEAAKIREVRDEAREKSVTIFESP